MQTSGAFVPREDFCCPSLASQRVRAKPAPLARNDETEKLFDS